MGRLLRAGKWCCGFLPVLRCLDMAGAIILNGASTSGLSQSL
jgi:hypothetical protein